MSETAAEWKQFLNDYGYYAVNFVLVDCRITPTFNTLHEWMRWDEPRYTGWPPFWWPTREEIAPKVVDQNTYECLHDGTGRVGHIERWRASTQGVFTIVRAYDSDYDEPGKYLELTIPVWRIGELLLYSSRMAGRFESPRVDFTLRYEGLAGRTLRSKLAPHRFLAGNYTTHAPRYERRVALDADDIESGAVDMTDELVRGLFELFQFTLPDNLCEAEIGRMKANRF